MYIIFILNGVLDRRYDFTIEATEIRDNLMKAFLLQFNMLGNSQFCILCSDDRKIDKELYEYSMSALSLFI